jgi:hypothetical protein
MIRLGLRLAVATGREAAVRLAVVAAAVALGVGLLLACLSGVNAVNAQNDRSGWLNAGVVPAAGPAADPIWLRLGYDHFDGRQIGVVDVAATGPREPVPPGMPGLPGPGEYYASPALAALLDTVPAGLLADRYPGRRAGVIGDAALPSPESLLVVVGRAPAELAGAPDAVRATGFPDSLPANCGGCVTGIPAAGLHLILAVVGAALLFPVLMFIGTATRLSATRREQRFAAMRLVGATPRQVSTIAAVEAAVSAVAGTATGFGLFLAFRGRLAEIPFTGQRFFPADLTPGALGAALVAVGVPVAAALAARLALRRIRLSPLGVSRRVTPRPPRAYRLIPLVLGVAELAWFIGRRPATSTGQVLAFMPGILTIMVGLVVAGPWLTMVGARALARTARRPAALIAARRLADDPKGAFRAVSGLILALFVTSVAVGVMGTIVAERGTTAGAAPARTLDILFREPKPATTALPAGLAGVPGVAAVVVVREAPDGAEPPRPADGAPAPPSLARCADIARSPDFGRCAPGARVAWVWSDLLATDDRPGARVWPAAGIAPAALAGLPVQSVVVTTDGSTAAVERARTLLQAAYPQRFGVTTRADWQAQTTRVLDGWQRLADVVTIAGLVIAGCSLAAAVTGGLVDRRRPFSLMRLAGAPLAVLRRVVALESAVPLLAAAAVAGLAGFGAAHLFLTAQMGYTVRAPGPVYYAVVAAGLAASLAVVASTLPLLRRITGPAAARNE